MKRLLLLLFFLLIPLTYAQGMLKQNALEITSPLTSNGEVKVMSIAKTHYELHQGDGYFIKTYIENTGATGTSNYFAFTTPETIEGGVVHAKSLLAVDVDFEITIYEGADITGGVAVVGVNNERNSNKTANMTAVAEPTINDIGTPIWIARSGGGRNAIGVSPGLNYEIIAKVNTTYVFEITKETTADGIADVDFWWYEEGLNDDY